MKRFLIIIDGPMGSGKSTIGQFLAKKLPRTAVLNTAAIKYFISDFERGERDNAISAAVVFQMSKEYIKQGLNMLLPQAFWKKEFVEPYIQLAKENNLEFFLYQLEGPKDFLFERVKNRPKPEQAATPVSEDRILKNLKTWEESRYQFGKMFDVSKQNSEQIAEAIFEDIV